MNEMLALAEEAIKRGDRVTAENFAYEATRLGLRLLQVQKEIEDNDLD